MKYCAYCGKQLLDEAIICPGCGCAATMQKIDSSKAEKSTLSLFALIFSILVPIVGFVLGIIGAFYHKVETNRKRSLYAISISLAMMFFCSWWLYI